jgi:hypothetical protein
MNRGFWIAAALLFMVGIGAYAYNGQYSRYLSDDFCIYNESIGRDAIAKTVEWYSNSGGRIAQYMTLVWSLSAGVEFASISPALLLAAWLLALTWALYPLARRVVGAGSAAWAWAAALILAALAGAPQIAQSLYWITGAYTYTAPLIAASLLFGVLIRARTEIVSTVLASIAAFALALIAGTFAEPLATWLAAILCLSCIALLVPRFGMTHSARRGVAVWIAGTLGALAAVVILVIAPGNAVRAGAFTASESVFSAGIGTIQYGLLYLLLAYRTAPVVLLGLYLLAVLVALTARGTVQQVRFVHLALWIGAGMVALIAFMFPGVYATSVPPPARSFIVPFFSLSVTVIGAGWLSGWITRGRRTRRRRVAISARVGGGMALAVIALMVGVTAVNELRYTATYTRHAAEWDARDAQLRGLDAGTDAVVAPFTADIAASMGLDTVGDNIDIWVNRCAAAYYGLASVRTG